MEIDLMAKHFIVKCFFCRPLLVLGDAKQITLPFLFVRTERDQVLTIHLLGGVRLGAGVWGGLR